MTTIGAEIDHVTVRGQQAGQSGDIVQKACGTDRTSVTPREGRPCAMPKRSERKSCHPAAPRQGVRSLRCRATSTVGYRSASGVEFVRIWRAKRKPSVSRSCGQLPWRHLRQANSPQNIAASNGRLHKLMNSDQTVTGANNNSSNETLNWPTQNRHHAQVTRRVRIACDWRATMFRALKRTSGERRSNDRPCGPAPARRHNTLSNET